MKKINENGGISSGDVAANYDRVQGMRRRELRSSDADWRSGVKFDKEAKTAKEPEHILRARENLAKYKEKQKMANPKERFKSFIARKMDDAKTKIKRRFQVTESFDMQDVVSRLKGMEASNFDDTVTYGVEDDDGNVMKITVRSDQAKKFEQRMAEELATIKTYADSLGTPPFSKYEDEPNKTSKSIAELLYNLRGEFDIIDVEFPEIPSDVIYNADRATYNAKDTLSGEPEIDSMGSEFDAQSPEGENVADNQDGLDMDQDMKDSPLEGDPSVGDEETSPDDLDSAEDFVEPQSPENTEQSVLQSVLKMLQAEAEARKAGYEKEAEEARAKQAEYSYKLATHTAAQQEELAQVEMEMERQKEKEKEAKRYADIAKYRVQKTKTAPIATESVDKIFEVEQVDSVSGLIRMKQGLRDQFQIMPNDTQEDKAFKNSAYIDAMRELDIRIRRAKKTQTYLAQKNRKEQQKEQKEKIEQQKQAKNTNVNQNQQSPTGNQV